MKHLSPVNEKARRLERAVDEAAATLPGEPAGDVVALQMMSVAHIPLGCSTVFQPGWEVDRTGGTAGLCQPVERDLYDCYKTCYWPVQVPDYLNYFPDWVAGCASATQDWRTIDLVFP